MTISYRFNSLDDFLITTPFSVDAQLDDGWGARFPVKGRELDATILFADISGFSRRTQDLSPAETLIFVNTFFAWITAEGLRDTHGIVDKYIGDEMMLVFSTAFGSTDPFAEALNAARRMLENDALAFAPHIGIASGAVIVGYVGTPVKYNASVFGHPVTIAARCAAIRSETYDTIVFPAAAWDNRDLDTVFVPTKVPLHDGTIKDKPHGWTLEPPKSAQIKNLPDLAIQKLTRDHLWLPSQSADERAREGLTTIRKAGRYWPAPSARPDRRPK